MALVRVKLADGTEVSVGKSFAESHNLKVLDKPARLHGKTLRAKHPVNLRGVALDAALEEAGLPKTGSADEKRDQLADHQLSAKGGGDVSKTNPVGESDTSEEDSK